MTEGSLLKSNPQLQNDHVSLQELDIRKINRTIIEQFLRFGSPGDADRSIEKLFGDIGNSHLQSHILRYYIAIDIYMTTVSFSEMIGVSQHIFIRKFGSIDQLIEIFSTIEGTKKYLAMILEQCISWRLEMFSEHSASIVLTAKDYIQKNYGSKDVSLNSIAAAVNVCPSYFSALFKKETGKTFIDYLTAVRMEKAMELLCRTSKKVSDISGEVGYSDYHYFSQQFKKRTGQTPREFQSNKNRRNFSKVSGK